jgi:hypothetical protein
MNLCEKNGGSINVYAGFCLFKKDGDFEPAKKLFVLQADQRHFDHGLTSPGAAQ